MNTHPYPPTPLHVTPDKLAPSPSFKKQVGKVIGSIVLFFIVYILLVLAACGLAVACFYLGFNLIIFSPRFITIMLGLGLMALGISVVFFLIKFIFAVSKSENKSRVALKERDQPALFAFIKRLTAETNTPLPKKIFISPDVNACVFYNSSFWSMFLPVRKNLEIGIGLVNSINLSEFKAVMAHEFGHFSQRSMKLGSFTYNVNQVIYNMLYENNSYTSFLQSWGNLNGYLAIFASITVKIASSIQWILRQMYKAINKNYLGLSREMEFHADAVAASVSGGNNLVSALSRIEIASACYKSAMSNADELVKQNKASENIFANQLTIFRAMASEHQLPLKNGLPEVSLQFISSFSKSRINYKDQWASHPTLEERKEHLEKLALDTPPDEGSAWLLFADGRKLQEEMTAGIYQSAQIGRELEPMKGEHFEDWFLKEKEASLLPPAYKGFYDKRQINPKNWDIDALCKEQVAESFDVLFSDDNARLQSTIDNNENDLEIVKAVYQKHIDVTSFDFDGQKHKREDCEAIIKQLEDESAALAKNIEQLDKKVFTFFYQHAGSEKESLRNNYVAYKTAGKKFDGYIETANQVVGKIQPFYQGNISINDVNALLNLLKEVHERNFKAGLRQMIFDNAITIATKGNLKSRVENYLQTDYVYFTADRFQNEELKELRKIVADVANELGEQRFRNFKKLLELQLKLYQKN
ncbi:MAG: M48 family metallopeptidase [Chitinophagaceae bacterium]